MMLWIAGGLGLLAAAMFLGLKRGTSASDEEELPLYAQPRDRRPLGEATARRMWRHVQDSEDGWGIVPYGHRDYCGHGLARMGRSVALCTVYDGRPRIEEPLARWDDEEAFVTFFARQSNRSMNGYDRGEPLFLTEDEHKLANQRLSRQQIRRILEIPPRSEDVAP